MSRLISAFVLAAVMLSICSCSSSTSSSMETKKLEGNRIPRGAAPGKDNAPPPPPPPKG
jgi:hypothetical protein